MYNSRLQCIQNEQAIIIDTPYLAALLEKNPTLCIGSAATKAKELLQDPSLLFIENTYNILDNIQLGEAAFVLGKFEDTAYCSPAYLKDFFFKK